MGTCMSSEGNEEQRKANQKIDGMIKKSKKEREIKLLLLGAGESGKTTLTKQIQIIHLKGFANDDEKILHRETIHSNIILAMYSLIEANEKIGNQKIKKQNKAIAEKFATDYLFGQIVTPEIAKAVKKLWSDPAIQEVFERSNEFQLLDCAQYYFENVDRISEENYIPTVEDILHARARTTGITEIHYTYSNVRWTIVDVGGQRNERRKWIHCFQEVNSLIFCTAISEYNQKLFEDERVNRMKESVTLFKELCNCDWFKNTPIILFLNKNDLFEEKIKTVDLNVCFKDYQGGCNYENAIAYIKKKFDTLNANPRRLIYPHVTVATDTENVRHVLLSVLDIVQRSSLEYSNLI